MAFRVIFTGMLVAVIVGGCETIVQPEEMTYDRKLVISAVLESGKSIDQILIGKTLPPNQPYIPANAAVTDADGSISVDGTAHALIFDGYYQPYGSVRGFGVYRTQFFFAEPGKVYTIDVKAEGLHATATTFVPAPAVVDSLVLSSVTVSGTVQYLLDGQIVQQPGVVYSPAYSYAPSADFAVREPVFGVGKSSPGYHMRFRIPVYGLQPSLHDSLTAVITSYDESYLDYYATRFNGNATTDDLGQSLSTVKWNVQGDGIGLFIGATITKRSLNVP